MWGSQEVFAGTYSMEGMDKSFENLKDVNHVFLRFNEDHAHMEESGYPPCLAYEH